MSVGPHRFSDINVQKFTMNSTLKLLHHNYQILEYGIQPSPGQRMLCCTEWTFQCCNKSYKEDCHGLENAALLSDILRPVTVGPCLTKQALHA